MADKKDVSIIIKAVDAVSAPITDIKKKFDNFASGIEGALKSAGLVAAFMFFRDFLKDCFSEALKAEEATSRLGQAVTNAGGNFAALQPVLDGAVQRVTKLSTATDDDLTEALARLITMTGNTGASMKNLGLVADVAAYKSINVADAADLVGKAMQGNTKVLKEFGIEGGTVAERMAALGAEVDGFAKEKANTLGGRLEILNREWHEFKESVGRAVLGTDDLGAGVSKLTERLVHMQAAVTENKTTLQGLGTIGLEVGGVIGGFFGMVGRLLVGFVQGWEALWVTLTAGVDQVAIRVKLAWAKLTGNDGLTKTLEAELTLSKESWANAVADIGGIADAGETRIDTGMRGHVDTRKGLTKDQFEALGAITAGGYDQLTRVQKTALGQLRDAQKGHHLVEMHLTKEQREALTAYTKGQDAASAAAAKKSHTNLEALQQVADKAQLELLSATQKQYEELTRTFQEKMQGMTKDDQAKAAQLLKEAQAALLLKWSNLYKEVVPTVAHGETDVRRELVGTQGYLEAIKVAIDEYSGGVDEGAARSILFKLKVADLGGTFKAASETMKNATHDLTGVLDKELLGKVDAIATAIGGLGDAMTKISTGDYLGGVTQGIGALVALGHTIFGGSNELKQQFQANTRRLEELRATMGDLVHAMSPGRVVSAVAGLNLSGFKPTRPRFSEGEFNQWLIGQGITPAELNQLAKDLGINIRDSAGNLNLAAVGQLIKGAGGADTGIGKDFKSKTTNIDEQISAGLLAPGQRFGALVGAGGDNAISKALSGLDPKDPAFHDKAIGKLQQIFSDLSSGKLGAADWGGLSRSDFHDLLMQLLGILTSGQEITGGWSAPIGRNPGGGGVSIPPPTLPGGLTIPPPISFSNFLGDGSPVITVLDQIQANTAALLGPRAGGAGAVAGAINASIGDIVINGGTVDAATLATLQSTLQVAQDRQLKAFEQALARNFDLSRAGAGNASRAAA